MVKVLDKHGDCLLYFPKNFSSCDCSNIHSLYLKSESSGKQYSFSFEDYEDYSDYYIFKYNREFKDLDDGEYKYYIDNCATGLLVIGTYYENNCLCPIQTPDYAIYDEEQNYIYYE